MTDKVSIRKAMPSDLDAVIALDDVGPREEKPAYWREIFERYVNGGRED